MTTPVPSPSSTPTGGPSRLVVHAARHVPMDAEAKARAVAALTALFIPRARYERAGPASRLDSEAPVEAELAGTESQLRETSAAIDRYLRAFEAGTMSDTLCAPRIVELSEHRTDLTARRNELSVHVRASAPQLPSAARLRVTSERLRQALASGSPERRQGTHRRACRPHRYQ